MGTSTGIDGDPYQTGQDALLKIGDQEYNITSVSYTKDVDTNEVRMNDSLTPSIAVTGISISGSFEHSGQNESLRSAIEHSDREYTDNGRVLKEEMEPVRATLSIKEYSEHGASRETTFTGVLVTSRSKEMPSDDSVSVTYDWVAESMSVSDI